MARPSPGHAIGPAAMVPAEGLRQPGPRPAPGGTLGFPGHDLVTDRVPGGGNACTEAAKPMTTVATETTAIAFRIDGHTRASIVATASQSCWPKRKHEPRLSSAARDHRHQDCTDHTFHAAQGVPFA